MNSIENSILPVLDSLMTDAIPNIRFNVAKSYAVLIDVLKRLPAEGTIAEIEKQSSPPAPSPHGKELIESRILPNLAKLQDDSDVDVRFFGMTAAQASGNDVQMTA